jgi:FKBP-type peptidyl-prolyl cis-trans isomerase
MKNLKLISLVTLGLVITACDPNIKKDDRAQYSYSMGVQVGKNIKSQSIDVDVKAFAMGMQDALGGKEIKLNDDEMRGAMQKMAETRRRGEQVVATENQQKGDEFLTQNKAKEGIKETSSGLQYKVVTQGKGKKPKASDTVEVHYSGRLIDGTEFDSSYKRGEPAQFPVGHVIPGWTEGLQLMTEGSKYEFYIPAKLAYGERGNPSIPPNSVLIFDVELIKIVK